MAELTEHWLRYPDGSSRRMLESELRDPSTLPEGVERIDDRHVLRLPDGDTRPMTPAELRDARNREAGE